MHTVNLDHISASQLLPEVQAAITDIISGVPGNPSSQNMAGERAAEKLEKARASVADLINAADPKEIVFTSGGTESINHALKGVARANTDKGYHIVTSNIEHNAVNRSIKRLMQLGCKATSVSVDSKGRVDPAEVAGAIQDNTILVSIMHSNNEIGTIQPISEIAKITKEKKIILHSDAVDSVGVVPFDVQAMGADLVSFASNPYYGPTGTGGLYIRKGTRIWPIIDGGVQEKNRRGGTENLIGIAGMGVAADLAKANMEQRLAHLRNLQSLLIKELPNYIDEYFINGDPENGLPNLVSVSIRYIEGESLMLMLEDEGFIVATRSACATGSLRASHVLMSIGLDHADAQGTLVISPGIENTEDDIMAFLAALKKVVGTLRDMSPLYNK
ncbi:MAG: cysteine desulfurase family protein [Thermodesulfobacteriota bacterium]|nr:cysteine desulfurase family protein [Thermodesulfobacteriota bacterium]